MKKKRFKKVTFKVGDMVIIRDSGEVIEITKVLNNGESYLINGNSNEEYLLSDLVKF